MASSKNSNEHQKSNWDDLAIEDSASDLEDSWAGEEVMFDGSPSSGIYTIFTLSKKNLLSHLYWGAQVSMKIS